MSDINSPLISVVLPVYDVESYIKEALDSVLNQTIQDFEILVIDDCSTDNTLDIVRGFDDSRIVIVTKEKNKGLIDSLNIGFELAKGKYIARMDGDDVSHSQRFEKQLEILQNSSDIKVCGCWLQRFGNANKIIKHKEYHDEIVAHLLLGCSMSMGAVMFDRIAFEGHDFDENKKHVEDYDFWARMAWSGEFYNIQEVLYYYRCHDTQVTQLYNHIQRQGDVAIKLFLFKKLKYNTKAFSDEMIIKILLLDDYISIKEFKMFLKWLNQLIVLNRKTLVYSPVELQKVLKILRRAILFKFYFEKTSIEISKNWRIRVLFILSIRDIIFVLNIKKREIKKRIFR